MHRLLLFTFAASLVAGGILIIVGKLVFAHAAGEYEPSVIQESVRVTNGIVTHHLTGMVEVHNTCNVLLQHIKQVDSTLFKIVFSTWRESSVECRNEKTPRHFRDSVTTATRDVVFIATLDGAPIPITIIRNG